MENSHLPEVLGSDGPLWPPDEDGFVSVRRNGRYVELMVGPGDDEWQFRAVVVGKGIEITRSDRFHGWVPRRDIRRWCKAVRQLAKECSR